MEKMANCCFFSIQSHARLSLSSDWELGKRRELKVVMLSSDEEKHKDDCRCSGRNNPKSAYFFFDDIFQSSESSRYCYCCSATLHVFVAAWQTSIRIQSTWIFYFYSLRVCVRLGIDVLFEIFLFLILKLILVMLVRCVTSSRAWKKEWMEIRMKSAFK